MFYLERFSVHNLPKTIVETREQRVTSCRRLTFVPTKLIIIGSSQLSVFNELSLTGFQCSAAVLTLTNYCKPNLDSLEGHRLRLALVHVFRTFQVDTKKLTSRVCFCMILTHFLVVTAKKSDGQRVE